MKLRTNVDETLDENRFWMKEQTALKRFDLCMECAMTPYVDDGFLPDRDELPKLNLITTRSTRIAQLGRGDESSQDESSLPKAAKPQVKYNEVAEKAEFADSISKKKRKKDAPEATSELVTLEELFGANKRLSLLYLKDYEIFKLDKESKREQEVSSSAQPHVSTYSTVEYSEGSDGECVVSSSIVNTAITSTHRQIQPKTTDPTNPSTMLDARASSQVDLKRKDALDEPIHDLKKARLD